MFLEQWVHPLIALPKIQQLLVNMSTLPTSSTHPQATHTHTHPSHKYLHLCNLNIEMLSLIIKVNIFEDILFSLKTLLLKDFFFFWCESWRQTPVYTFKENLTPYGTLDICFSKSKIIHYVKEDYCWGLRTKGTNIVQNKDGWKSKRCGICFGIKE